MGSPNPAASPDRSTPCEKFYGLSAPPFSLTPDPRFAYPSRSHARALEQVTDALRRREGLILITGAIGTGKTMLCRALLEGFREVRIFLSVILDPCLSVDDLLCQVLADFGLISPRVQPQRAAAPDATHHALVSTLQRFLASLIPLNAHAVIMIDEAQHLDPAVLEQIRLLSNFETDDAKLLQIVLVGQPDLEQLLRRADMQQLNQRIARRVELHPLSGHEVADYVTRRLSVASTGPSSDVRFTPPAVRAIERISGGVPRVVNILCGRSLEQSYERNARTIDRDVVLAAAADLKLPVPASLRVPASARSGAIAATLLVAAVLGGWWWTSPVPASPASPASMLRGSPLRAPESSAAVAQAHGGAAHAASDGRDQVSAPAALAEPAPAALPNAQAPNGVRKSDSYDISVAAFRTSKRAIDVASDIAAKGLPVTTRADPSGKWYQVVVGPYASAEEAEAAQRALAREGFADTRVSSSIAER